MLAIIPARGGSKGLPGKNLLPLGGQPMIVWSIQAARGCGAVDRVVVSSDDPLILQTAERYDPGIGQLRPGALASDSTPMVDVIEHVLGGAQPRPHWLVLLQPTSPLRRASDIDASFTELDRHGADSSVSVTPPAKSPYWMYRAAPEGQLVPLFSDHVSTRRQDLPAIYALNGAVYVTSVERFERERSFVDEETVRVEMPAERSVDIDTALDLALARVLMGAPH